MKRFLIPLMLIFACSANEQTKLFKPIELTCEYIKNPSVVDIPQPRLAWVNVAQENERGQKQTAYQIRVASSVSKLSNPDLWDSDKVMSMQSNRIEYAGEELNSRQECWWQVRVWDKDNVATEWSQPAFWRMGLLQKSDWLASWIGAPWQGEEHFKRPDYPGQQIEEFGPPAPLLRKGFEIEKEIEKAVAYVTGLGYFEFYANGKKVGDDVLIPNNTNYGKRPNLGDMYINVEDNFRDYKVMYLAYDISENLRQGNNSIGAILGNGFYNPRIFWCEGYGTPRFLGQVHITYKDGTTDVIASDESWKVAKSPIIKNMLYYGEIYDARMEQEGWSTADFDDSSWENAAKRKAPYGRLVAHTAPTDKIMEQLKPVEIKKLENGNYFVDFGKEISGWVRLHDVEAPRGHEIHMSFNSNLYSGENSYIFSGKGKENYAPRFNWFVFSGVEIDNWHGELQPENVTAEAVNTYVEHSSEFETSNPLLNRINEIWQRSQLDNMHGGVASDCPHRERNGYTGDGQVACATVMHNFDTRAFYQKWITDMHDAQNPETGYVPNGAPWQPGCGGGVAWGAAICIMPWEFYKQYGAVDMLEENYEAMKGYVRYMQTWVDEDGIMFSQRRNNSGEVLKWFNIGDWVSPGELPPGDLVHTFYYWLCADITAKVAEKLGKSSEASIYRSLADEIKQAFYTWFYNQEKGSFGNYGSNIFALRMGVPKEVENKVVSAVKQNIQHSNGHFDTGIFGTRYFFEVLAKHNLQDMAYEAITKTDEPSFGHWIELGSTTTREHWSEKGSFNHPMFGGGLVWFYQNLAGLQPDENDPGYRHIIFKPQPVDDLMFVRYQNATPYGPSKIMWTNKEEEFSMDILVPVSATATIYIPSNSDSDIFSGENSLPQDADISNIRYENGYTICEVESGLFQFRVK